MMPSKFSIPLSPTRIDQDDAVKQVSLWINWIIIELSPDHIWTDWKARVGEGGVLSFRNNKPAD